MLALVLSLAVALVPHGAARQDAPQREAGGLPKRGVLIVGSSLGGIKLGQTQAAVRSIWGGKYVVCPVIACKDPTWLYIYPPGPLFGDPVGGAVGTGVRFQKNKVVAVFTLGALLGWKTGEGIKVADPTSRVYEVYGEPAYTQCIGFSAMSMHQSKVVSSIYLTAGVVYGFGLSVPGINVCP